MDDLVAELTLRLNNEMAGGIDEIDAEFGVLDSTLQGLRDVLGELTTALNDLKAPVALSDGLSAVSDRAGDATAAVSAIGDAIDADAAKLKALQSLWLDGAGTFLPPTGDNDPTRPAFIPPGYLPPSGPPEPGDPEPRPSPDRNHSGAGGDALTGGLFGIIELATGREAANEYADFVKVLNQTAIKDGLSGDRAQAEIERLTSSLDGLAIDTGESSQQLAEAYYWLVTTGMNKALIDKMMPSLAMDASAYNLTPLDDAQSVYTLQGVMGVPADQMPKALSMLSEAAQLGHFSVADFGHYLPVLGAQMALLKDGGLSGEAQISAALEATRKDSGTSEDDFTNLRDLLNYITSPIASRFFDRTKRSEDLLAPDTRHLFDKYHLNGIDISKFLDDKEDKGEGAFDAMMDLVAYIHQKLPSDISGSDEKILYGSLFHNAQAGSAAIGIAENFGLFKSLEQQLSDVSPTKVQTDFQTNFQSPAVQLSKTDEEFTQMVRTLGQDLIPALTVAGIGADWFAKGLNAIGDAFNSMIAGPLGSAIGGTAANLAHDFRNGHNSYIGSDDGLGLLGKWIGIHVTTDPGATATVTKTPPGVNVKVNQGTVLNTP
jgi:hypothetical protein